MEKIIKRKGRGKAKFVSKIKEERDRIKQQKKGKTGKHQREFIGFDIDGWEEVGEDDKFVLFEHIEMGRKRGIIKDCRNNPDC